MRLRLEIRSFDKFLLNSTVMLLLGAAVPCSTMAQARSPLTTTFTFTREVNWGSAVLAPGEYVVTVSSDAPPMVTVSQKGGTVVALITPSAVSPRPFLGDLEAVTTNDANGRNYVSALYMRDSGTLLNFAAPDARASASDPSTQERFVQGGTTLAAGGFLTIRNLRKQAIPYGEAQTIYLSACKVVEQEFSRTDPVRPALTLLLGSDVEGVFYEQHQIQLKKWDKYLFAQGVVMLAVADMLPKDKRLSLTKLAVLEGEATVDVSDLKSGQIPLSAGPRN